MMMMMVVVVVVVVVMVELIERSPEDFSVRVGIFKSFSLENRRMRDA